VSFNSEAGRGDLLFLTLRAGGGEDWLFILDTGSPTTFLDKSLERQLGKRLETRMLQYGWLGQRSVGVYAAPALYLGNSQLATGAEVLTDDLSFMVPPGRRVQGILGMDCLYHYCVQLDFIARKCRFLDADKCQSPELGTSFPLRTSGSGLCIRATLLDTRDTEMAVDTALAFDGALGSKIFQQAVDKQKDVSIWHGGGHGGDKFRRAAFPEGVVGNQTYKDLLMVERPSGENFLGLRFLARHLVTFNFPSRTLYLKPLTLAPLLSVLPAPCLSRFVMRLSCDVVTNDDSNRPGGCLYQNKVRARPYRARTRYASQHGQAIAGTR
jgi:hypothetical protein